MSQYKCTSSFRSGKNGKQYTYGQLINSYEYQLLPVYEHFHFCMIEEENNSTNFDAPSTGMDYNPLGGITSDPFGLGSSNDNSPSSDSNNFGGFGGGDGGGGGATGDW